MCALERNEKGMKFKMIRFLSRMLYRSATTNKDISYKDLKSLMKNKYIVLIDVRSGQEYEEGQYEEGHLDGAINIPVYNIEKEISKYVRNAEDTIILYCSSGSRSRQAKEILENLGYSEVYNLKEGIDKIWIK